METNFDCKMVPVAIIGMGCNLPGKVRSPGQFWDLIMSKGIANNAKVPVARFNVDSYLHENNNRPGSFNISGGYFLDGSLVEFDPAVFEISPIEAAWMDPQQRKLLEVVYEAIESSGNTLEQVGKDVTGYFAASFSHDFQQMALKEPDFRHPYTTTGIDAGILSNRISHVFNLRGPSVATNTACSSSMYALHAACSAIRNEECEAAIVGGGANLILSVDQQMNTAALNVLSPTNICHTFDEAADGYGRAEGVGALYIKRLDLAIKNGDPIRAVIRSTAVNANGKVRDAAITFPSFQGQADVMKAAYNLSGLDPVLTGYVECHGTGTQVGDPVEVRAVGDTMRPHTGAESPILIGSVKPNVGHSEASSSISTVIKTVLAIERGVIPPTAGVVNLNKKINWSGLQVKVVTDPTPFPTNLPIRRVGVNAFGNGDENIENLNRPYLLVFSAHDRETLERNIDAHAQLNFGLAKGQPMLDLAYTLACRRTKLTRRAFAVCRKESYVNSLSSALENDHAEKGPATVALIFTGQVLIAIYLPYQIPPLGILKESTDSPSALALVEGLKASGVNAVVLRANVASKPQILKAIASIDPKYPIRGVVHAAMVLKDKLFQKMDINSWQQVLEPKVKGCLNLHEVFSNKTELDFFVMTSSVSGTLGSAGQSNYAAANSFLDFLARHRRKQGLTGISLILPMVVGIGYVADHAEIETSLRRKGFYGIDESEMLASFEVAMMAHQPEADHIIAGIEPSRLAKAISATETKVTWPLEPRLSIILAKMENQIANDGVTKSSSILAKIENSLDKEEAVNCISEHLVHGLSTVLMINKDEINPQARAIASYGLDSMIGAEFRNWIFTEFKVDIPFQQLLAPNSTIASFAEILYNQTKKVSLEYRV
ncbi:uncharacterized protein EAF02_010301 [Botrytis sinoallii]|uniref:uncharacterized protein n=1 Tax=Botrytis sinoallii TaxID=1463999 RepID=UPI0019017C81|nr:uncharacterized protein EAF02_010301 [Botrytis sinoallii]KAF7864333.1 hypothetical protein EAF02_010301 [Botrytis sinoallii]